MCLSSYATTPLEDVIKVGNNNPYMIQMCVVRDRNVTAQLLRRAEGTICSQTFVYWINPRRVSAELVEGAFRLLLCIRILCAD